MVRCFRFESERYLEYYELQDGALKRQIAIAQGEACLLERAEVGELTLEDALRLRLKEIAPQAFVELWYALSKLPHGTRFVDRPAVRSKLQQYNLGESD